MGKILGAFFGGVVAAFIVEAYIARGRVSSRTRKLGDKLQAQVREWIGRDEDEPEA